ncbi:hypothetical protein BCR36DRAFT_580828 [Piromyces finnis]|uniref:Periplasmic binding protein-like II n=1 Tax=Piromyces finnis TaxID=1754191 RepID=A0A1Y1VIK0_9FUNG|nr:hypothetical protein BCR36DRAFT_580828 [Piromyces finnis]|eukprot:ORX56518.1 hypothetical protein BCR36DRAFT_580828 [Piromyces finnis]
MKSLFFTILTFTQTLLIKALNPNLQFKYANTIIYEQPVKEIQVLKYKLENVYYIIYEEKFADSPIYHRGLIDTYEKIYCSDGNSCRFFAKPLKQTAVDSSQIIRFFEYFGTDIIKYLGNVGHITSGCAYNNAMFLEAKDNPEVLPIDGFFYTDPNSNFVKAYKDQSIYFNGINENTPMAKFEWIKFISVFYGLEKEATNIFESVLAQYNCNKNLIQNNKLFASLRVAWLTSQAPNKERWFTNDYEYVKALLADAGATLNHDKEITSYKNVKSVLSQSHFLIDISSESSGEYKITDFYDQYRYNINDDLLLLREKNIIRNDAARSEDGVRTWEDDYMAFPHLVLLDLIYWFHPRLFVDNGYNSNIVKKLYGDISVQNSTQDAASLIQSITNGNNTNSANNTVVNDTENTEANKLRKRNHISHNVSSYWFRNIPRNTNFKIIPKEGCPSVLSSYVTNNICLSDVYFKGDYDEYAAFDDVMTQVKNYAIIYYPIIGIVVIFSLILGFIFLKMFRKRQLEKKGYNDNQKILYDNEGFMEF